MTHMFSHPLTDRLVLKRPITTIVKYSLGRVSYEQELTVQYNTIQYNTIFISTCDICEPKKVGYNNVCI